MPDLQAGTAMEVFCSYAHADEAWRTKLETHLSLLKRENVISVWHDRKIVPGTSWAQEIDQHIESASLILLLISPDFIASDYCYNIEMKRALERHLAGDAFVIPILVRRCDWQAAPFASLQALPAGRFITEWNEREEDTALAMVAAGIREALQQLAAPASHTQAGLSSQFWNVPFSRNPFFIGREEQLAQVHAQLQQSQSAAIGQVQAISGLGGIGKTQLAVEYAYRHREEYEAVLWVSADTLETLNASYSELATLLNLPERDARKQEVIVQVVKAWLETHRDWLLILDNLDEPQVLFPSNTSGRLRYASPFLPSTSRNHVLLTTRADDLSSLSLSLGFSRPLRMETFTPEQGARLLLVRAERLERATPQSRQEAEQIARDLGGLALAIDQAGAYLAATGASFSSYLQLLHQRSTDLLKQQRNSLYPASVATTWSISFERVEVRNPTAAELLRFCAFLAPDAIPEEILAQGAEHLGDVLAPAAADPLQIDAAIESLRASSLIARDPQTRTFTVHRLVQAVQRDSLPIEIQHQWMLRTVLAINATFPYTEITNWPACERLLPHALLCASWIEQAQIITPVTARLLNETGVYLDARGRYAEAEPLYQQALAIRQQLLGPVHPGTAEILNNLAGLYQKQGKYSEAEPLYLRALDIREQHSGALRSYMAITLNNLAGLYKDLGRYAEAEPLLLRALAIDEQVYGHYHPAVATNLNNLAALYENQKKYKQAEPLYQQALAIREQHLEQPHPGTAEVLNNLAGLYQTLRKDKQAEALYLRALTINQQVYGHEHPEVATNLNNLALLYISQKKYEEAERLLQRALAINQQKLGQWHPFTANSLYIQAHLFMLQENYTQAEPLFQHALAIYEQTLGAHHQDMQRAREDYEELLRRKKRRRPARRRKPH